MGKSTINIYKSPFSIAIVSHYQRVGPTWTGAAPIPRSLGTHSSPWFAPSAHGMVCSHVPFSALARQIEFPVAVVWLWHFVIQPGMMIIDDLHWPTLTNTDIFGSDWPYLGLKQVETGWNRLKPPSSCGDCFAAGFWWNFVDLCCVHKHPQALPRHSLLGLPKLAIPWEWRNVLISAGNCQQRVSHCMLRLLQCGYPLVN